MDEVLDTSWLIVNPNETVASAYSRLQKQLKHDGEIAVGPTRLGVHPFILWQDVRKQDEQE